MSKQREETRIQNLQTHEEQTEQVIYFEMKNSRDILGYKLEWVDYVLLVLFMTITITGYIAINLKVDAIMGYILPLFAMGITLFIFTSYLWYCFKVLLNYFKNHK